jgi:hypothetical protein
MLAEALASLAVQRGVEVEAIVVNDAGPDVSGIVAEAANNLTVRLIDQPANRGLSAARNAGIQAAKGRFLALLDDDDVFLPHHLYTAVTALEDTGADVAYTDCAVSDQPIDPATADQAGIDQIPYAFDYPFDAQALLVANFIPVHSVVMRSLKGTGAWFDTSLPVEEDWEMWLRLNRTHGMRFVHVPQRTVIYHRLREVSSMTTDPSAGTGGRLATFRNNHRQLMDCWPVPADSAVATYRGHLMRAYELGFAQLASGSRLSHFYYERVLRVLYDGLTGSLDHTRVPDLLAAAVIEEKIS